SQRGGCRHRSSGYARPWPQYRPEYRAGASLLSRSAVATAHALIPGLEEGLTLTSAQRVAGILQRLGEALGRLVGHLHLLDADRLDAGRVDGRGLQGGLHRLAVLDPLVAQRPQVLESGLQDVGHLLLLLGVGVGAAERLVHALLDALLQLGGIDRLAIG